MVFLKSLFLLESVLHPTARADETPLPPGGQVRNPEEDARDKTDPDPTGGVEHKSDW